jgi:hypothetical protein
MIGLTPLAQFHILAAVRDRTDAHELLRIPDGAQSLA